MTPYSGSVLHYSILLYCFTFTDEVMYSRWRREGEPIPFGILISKNNQIISQISTVPQSDGMCPVLYAKANPASATPGSRMMY